MYFGTFNPVHNGHVALGNYFVTQTDLETVWFVVTPQNPFKINDPLLEDPHRLEMVRLALLNQPQLEVCDVEFTLPKPNYTLDTIQFLKQKFPHNDYVLLMGEDNLAHFERWKSYATLLDLVTVYVYPRKHKYPVPEKFLNHPKIQLIQAPMLDYASKKIRSLIQQGVPVDHLMPQQSWHYLKKHQFYM